MFNSYSGPGSARSGAATPPYANGAGTPPLGPQPPSETMMSAMGSQQVDHSMASVDLVPRLGPPGQGMPPQTFPPGSLGPLPQAQAYGPGGWAASMPPMERSTDLTNTGASLDPRPRGGLEPPGSGLGPLPPQTAFPGGLTPPGTRFPGVSMPPLSGPPGSMAMGGLPPNSMSMPPLTVPPGAPGPPLGPAGPPSYSPPTASVAGQPGMAPQDTGVFRTMAGPPSEGNLGGLGKEFVVTVSRLLDMPERKNFFGKVQGFRVRAFDDMDRELAVSNEIPPDRGPEADSIQVEEEDGQLRIRTESQLLFLQVEHAGVMGSEVIGRCQIHRLDPRSSQIWPYALSDADGHPANCGIELKVAERQPPPMGGPQQQGPPGSRAASVGPPSSSTRPSRGPASLPPSSRRAGWTLGEGSAAAAAAGMQDMNHGVSALMEFDKATDLPYPSDETVEQLIVMVMDEEKNRELRRVGPFDAKDQRGGFRRLVMADCRGARVFARAPLHFGGSAEEGAMFLRVGIFYLKGPADMELIGITDPIKVSWRPAEKKYYEVRQTATRKVLGGVYLTHRLMTEGEMAGVHPGAADVGAPSGPGRRPQVGAPAQADVRVSGRTGHFPPGSREEALEQAAINAEAQNRALLQRCRIADPGGADGGEGHVRTVNGYRQWDSLDSLFASMGPNVMAHSEELGPSVARSYCERTNMLKELVPKLGPTGSTADEQLNLRLVDMMYGEDPWKVTQTLRPVVCKDPQEIAATEDMTWCPDPPVYAPLRNMSEQDKETLRLACFDPRQSAKLAFADANPNYRIEEDVWGVLADYRTARSLVVPKPESAHRRVKDDCLMA